MRLLKLITRPTKAYSSAEASIQDSKRMNVELRTISDEEIRGSVVQSLVWTERSRTLRFLDDVCLVVEAALESELPRATLQRGLGDQRVSEPSDVECELVGPDPLRFTWERRRIAGDWIGVTVSGLYFSDSVYVYATGGLCLACSNALNSETGEPHLLWHESD